MLLVKSANALDKVLSPLVTVCGQIGAMFIVIIMLLTVVDVVGRRAFESPIIGSIELSEMMLVIVVFGSMAVCELVRGHVTIDLLTKRFQKKTREIIDCVMYLLFLVIYCLITWQLLVRAISEIGGAETTMVLVIPIFPVLFIAAFFSVLFSLVIFMHFLQLIIGVLQK